MITIELPSGKYLLVTVPEDAHDFMIDDELFYKAYYMGLENIGQMIKLPSGSWQLLGLAKDLTPNQWNDIVEKIKLPLLVMYKNYERKSNMLHSPVQSGFSLLSKHNLKPETTVILKQSNI